MQHQFWADFLVKLLRREESERDSGFLQCRALLVGLLRTFCDICSTLSAMGGGLCMAVRTVITQVAVENSRQHQRFVEERVDALLICYNAHNAVLGERARA